MSTENGSEGHSVRKSTRQPVKRRAYSPTPAPGTKQKRDRKVNEERLIKIRGYDVNPLTGGRFVCDKCGSQHITDPKKRKGSKWITAQPRLKKDQNTGLRMCLCTDCGLLIDKQEASGPRTPRARQSSAVTEKDREIYARDCITFLRHMSKLVDAEELSKLLCPNDKWKICGCSQNYILSKDDISSVEVKGRLNELLAYHRESKKLRELKSYQTSANDSRTPPPGKIGLGNGRKKSQAYFDFVHEKHEKLRKVYNLCEDATRQILAYSNNLFYRRLKTEEGKSRMPLKFGKAIEDLIPISALPERDCCVNGCVMVAKTAPKMLLEWRERAYRSQQDKQAVIAEMLTPAAGKYRNCFHFVGMVTGSCNATCAKIFKLMRENGGDRTPRPHRLTTYLPPARPSSTDRIHQSTSQQESTSLLVQNNPQVPTGNSSQSKASFSSYRPSENPNALPRLWHYEALSSNELTVPLVSHRQLDKPRKSQLKESSLLDKTLPENISLQSSKSVIANSVQMPPVQESCEFTRQTVSNTTNDYICLSPENDRNVSNVTSNVPTVSPQRALSSFLESAQENTVVTKEKTASTTLESTRDGDLETSNSVDSACSEVDSACSEEELNLPQNEFDNITSSELPCNIKETGSVPKNSVESVESDSRLDSNNILQQDRTESETVNHETESALQKHLNQSQNDTEPSAKDKFKLNLSAFVPTASITDQYLEKMFALNKDAREQKQLETQTNDVTTPADTGISNENVLQSKNEDSLVMKEISLASPIAISPSDRNEAIKQNVFPSINQGNTVLQSSATYSGRNDTTKDTESPSKPAAWPYPPIGAGYGGDSEDEDTSDIAVKNTAQSHGSSKMSRKSKSKVKSAKSILCTKKILKTYPRKSKFSNTLKAAIIRGNIAEYDKLDPEIDTSKPPIVFFPFSLGQKPRVTRMHTGEVPKSQLDSEDFKRHTRVILPTSRQKPSTNEDSKNIKDNVSNQIFPNRLPQNSELEDHVGSVPVRLPEEIDSIDQNIEKKVKQEENSESLLSLLTRPPEPEVISRITGVILPNPVVECIKDDHCYTNTNPGPFWRPRLVETHVPKALRLSTPALLHTKDDRQEEEKEIKNEPDQPSLNVAPTGLYRNKSAPPVPTLSILSEDPTSDPEEFEVNIQLSNLPSDELEATGFDLSPENCHFTESTMSSGLHSILPVEEQLQAEEFSHDSERQPGERHNAQKSTVRCSKRLSAKPSRSAIGGRSYNSESFESDQNKILLWKHSKKKNIHSKKVEAERKETFPPKRKYKKKKYQKKKNKCALTVADIIKNKAGNLDEIEGLLPKIDIDVTSEAIGEVTSEVVGKSSIKAVSLLDSDGKLLHE